MLSPPADFDPVAMLEEHLAVGWECDVEVVIDAPVDALARCVPRTIGRREPLDAATTRLAGSTSNPVWYAEQLAAIPAPYRIVRCPELQEATHVLGQRLLAAGQPEVSRPSGTARRRGGGPPPAAAPASRTSPRSG